MALTRGPSRISSVSMSVMANAETGAALSDLWQNYSVLV